MPALERAFAHPAYEMECDMSGKAERRASRARLKKKRRGWWGYNDKTAVQLGRVVDTPTPCSCWMCGNPRKYFGRLSINEQRWFQDIDEDNE